MSVSAAELGDLPWNELKKLAKDNEIKVSGTRDDLTAAVLEVLGHTEAPKSVRKSARKPLTASKASNLASPAGSWVPAPKTAGKSVRKSTRKSLAIDKIDFDLGAIENTEVPTPKELFVESNAAPAPGAILSPEMKVKKGRKALLRSPSPAPASTRKAAPKSSKKKTAASPKEASPEKADMDDEADDVTSSVGETSTFLEREAVEAFSCSAVRGGILAVAAAGALLAAAAGAWVAAGTLGAPPGSEALRLAGPSSLRLVQGEAYVEQGLDLGPLQGRMVREGLAAPGVTFEYSEPGVAFGDYVEEVGSFTVDYTVTAPWLGTVTLSREVVVGDVDECAYTGPIARFVAACPEGTACANTEGSYTCT